MLGGVALGGRWARLRPTGGLIGFHRVDTDRIHHTAAKRHALDFDNALEPVPTVGVGQLARNFFDRP